VNAPSTRAGGPAPPADAAPPRAGPLRRTARAVLGSTRGRTLLAIFVCGLAFQGWLSWAAPGKIVGQFPTDRDRVNLLVTLPFPPERFHVLKFQGYGRVSGTDGNTVEVRGVSRDDLARLARPYWVSRVEPLKP
jgi:hypothetical protein